MIDFQKIVNKELFYMKKYLFYLSFCFVINLSTVFPSENSNDSLEFFKNSIKASLTSASSYYCGHLGSAWAVDLTAQNIGRVTCDKNPIFDFFICGAIRGKALLIALPEASERGALIGAAFGAFLVPFLWDCSLYVSNSCARTISGKGSYFDNFISGATSIGTLSLSYALYTYF